MTFAPLSAARLLPFRVTLCWTILDLHNGSKVAYDLSQRSTFESKRQAPFRFGQSDRQRHAQEDFVKKDGGLSLRLVLVFALIAASSSVAPGQSSKSSLSGVVFDPTGALIPGVDV